MLVDLSHTSDETARHALNITRAPVIWSHSSARTLHDVPRNVPDDILMRIGMYTDAYINASHLDMCQCLICLTRLPTWKEKES
jgi:microsomal dipeptidase-like Zn-dependent dipeptidase